MENDNAKPATKQDLAAALDNAVQTIATTVQAEIKAAGERTAAEIKAAEARAQETARAMQTEILRGIEAFARGNFARMHRIETSDTDTNERITALEERVLYLETRRQ
jgi:uncharacterized membrane protein YgcG